LGLPLRVRWHPAQIDARQYRLVVPDDARELAKKAMAYKDWFGEDPQVKKAKERAKARITLG
jgi:hypothetical protein